MTKLTTAVFAFVLAAMASACQTLPEEPASPTYAKDVRPILMAHCVRCHGAQGMLANEDGGTRTGVLECYLDQMDDRGDCSRVDGALPPLGECRPGAKFCASTPISGTSTLFDVYVFGAAGTRNRMPPPPSPELNEWEVNTLKRWAATGAPP